MQAAEKAIALDPQLTWISAKVSHATYLIPGYDPHPWVERLKAWDPQNGFPYLLEASANVHGEWEKRWAKHNAATGDLRKALAAEPRWRVPMEKAFAAPRLDFYDAQGFALDRQVLQEQGFDRPDMLMAAAWSQPMPEILMIKFYEDIQLRDIGEQAEKSGRTEDALTAYWSIAHFGDRLKATPWDLAQVVANELRGEAYKRILPLLRRERRSSEAAAVESALAGLPPPDLSRMRPFYSSLEVTSRRSGQVSAISAVLVAFFGVSTVLWLLSIFALKWKADVSRTLNRVAAVLSFAPPALLFASIALFLAYYPYARPIGQIRSTEELQYGYALFFVNLYDFTTVHAVADIWLTRMFWPAIWCAMVALVGACSLWWVRRRTGPDRADTA
jgi:hypothetical protein